MKPVLHKVATRLGIYDDKIKPYYDKEIKPYTGSLSRGGAVVGAGIGGILGYLINRYLLGNTGTGSAIAASVGGALAGASLQAANEILSERRRIKENAGLPPEEQVREDGTSVQTDEKPGWIDTFSGLSTGAGALGGRKWAVNVFDNRTYHKPLARLDEQITELENAVKSKTLSTNDNRAAIRQLKNLRTQRSGLRAQRDVEAKFFGGRAGRHLTGLAGAAAGSAAMYTLTNPRSREWISSKIDNMFSSGDE